jgi:hypothetical protein
MQVRLRIVVALGAVLMVKPRALSCFRGDSYVFEPIVFGISPHHQFGGNFVSTLQLLEHCGVMNRDRHRHRRHEIWNWAVGQSDCARRIVPAEYLPFDGKSLIGVRATDEKEEQG